MLSYVPRPMAMSLNSHMLFRPRMTPLSYKDLCSTLPFHRKALSSFLQYGTNATANASHHNPISAHRTCIHLTHSCIYLREDLYHTSLTKKKSRSSTHTLQAGIFDHLGHPRIFPSTRPYVPNDCRHPQSSFIFCLDIISLSYHSHPMCQSSTSRRHIMG